MRTTKLFSAALLVLLTATQLHASQEETGRQTIRVGLTSLGARSAVTIIPQSDALLSIPGSTSRTRRVPSRSKLTIRWQSPSQLFCEGHPTSPAMRISCPGLIAAADRYYPGTIEVWPDSNGRLTIINEVPLEQYVRGVLLAEAGNGMHPEALKALAVAARSYGLACLSRHSASGFDVCDTAHCQGYRPYLANPKIEAAAAATSGEVLLYEDSPILAAYCTDCGGATANNEDAGFGTSPRPYLRGVRDAPAAGPNYCAASRHQSWRREFALDDIAKRLASVPSAALAHLTDVAFEDPDQFGRARTVILRGCERPPSQTASPDPPPADPQPLVTRSIPSALFRRIIGDTRLPSTAATARLLPGGRLEITGRGFGHGVGMCLAGADGMAKPPHNASYRAILAHYYGPAVLAHLPSDCSSPKLTSAPRRPSRSRR